MHSLRDLRAGLGRSFRAVRSSVGGSAVVLTYHRVLSLPSDPESLLVDPALFDEQIALLASAYNVLSATELCSLLDGHKRIPARSVVVTFDDGYFDLLTEVKPVLERHGVPATAFISTEGISTRDEHWWDQLAFLVSGEVALGGRLRFSAAGHELDFAAGDPSERSELYGALYQHLLRLGAEARRESLDALWSSVGTAPPQREEYRSLTEDEVRQLAAGGLVSIGAHTVSHQKLSAVSADEQRTEIVEGHARLESILGEPVTLFSYPYGGRDAFSSTTRELVADAGFSCAFANWFGLVFPWTGRFALPRCPTENIGAREFSARLEHWFSMGR